MQQQKKKKKVENINVKMAFGLFISVPNSFWGIFFNKNWRNIPMSVTLFFRD